jgi:hypothetical protein
MIYCRHIKCISHLIYDQGKNLQNHEDLEKELVSYYQYPLSKPPCDISHSIEKITQHILANIAQEHNESLLRPIMIEEVDQVVHDTPKGKSHGPDGFTVDFFHYCWPMIREEV